MKSTVKTIGKIVILGAMLSASFLLGTVQGGTHGRIPMPIDSIPCTNIDTDSDGFMDNYVDMRKVTEFTVTDGGLQLYYADGSGYYWER